MAFSLSSFRRWRPAHWAWAFVTVLLGFWLAPTLWLLITYGNLQKQEPDAQRLIQISPIVRLKQWQMVEKAGITPGRPTGRYLIYIGLGRTDHMDRHLTDLGWKLKDQGGSVKRYKQYNEYLSSNCRRFSFLFEVCDVKSGR